jgi:hypothetical protein
MLEKLLLLSLLIFSCNADAISPNNLLLGSWKMKQIDYIYADKTHSVEQALMGTFMFTPKRYVIMYNPWKNPRMAFKSLAKPSDSEIIASFKTIVYNSGSYTLTNSAVTTIADIAKVPGFEGGQQFYNYKLENDRLEMTMFDEIYPNGDKPEWFGKLKVRFILQKE